jgi:L-asparaginase
MPTVHRYSTGGTIASEPGEGGAAPAKAGAALVDAVPAVVDYADLRVTDVASRPGFDTRLGDVAAVAREVAASDDDVDGVVVTHGTDTLADTAAALDHLCSGTPPVVVTGSQRRFDEPGRPPRTSSPPSGRPSTAGSRVPSSPSTTRSTPPARRVRCTRTRSTRSTRPGPARSQP